MQGYLVNNNLVTRLLYKDPAQAGRHLEKRHDMGFYKEQQRVALYNRGLINPELIEEYLAAEGYQGLAKCLQTMRPDQVVNEIRISGLRGRGGGFPSGVKWEVAARRESDLNYVVCNADEGAPAPSWLCLYPGGIPPGHQTLAACGRGAGLSFREAIERDRHPIRTSLVDKASWPGQTVWWIVPAHERAGTEATGGGVLG